MPSPFPGMDPYLEGALWTTVHFSLSAEIVRQLAPKVRPRYLVLPAERFVMETLESVAVTATDMYPDVAVVQPQAVAGCDGLPANFHHMAGLSTGGMLNLLPA